MLTPFGITVRKLRLDRGMRLLDLAKKTGQSASFISAVETGRKAIPDGYVAKMARAMELTAPEIRELGRAADRTRTEVRLDKMNPAQREIVHAFARRLDDIPSELLAALKKAVLQSICGDTPFQRRRRGVVVPARSFEDIRSFAEKVRSAFVTADEIEFPIMDVLEFRLGQVFPGYYLDPRSIEEMGDDEGRVVAGSLAIALREDVYEGAWMGDRRARFTASHELAHFLMHREVTLMRARDDDDKIFRDSEWQADRFAGSLLMSARHLSQFDDADDAAEACNINPAAARTMWGVYAKGGLIAPAPTPNTPLMRRFL
jgi:Zn-dependent peptidase ImmA (M78 family)/transcriptional regulator with XRE-family HTH domain